MENTSNRKLLAIVELELGVSSVLPQFFSAAVYKQAKSIFEKSPFRHAIMDDRRTGKTTAMMMVANGKMIPIF